MFSQFFIAFGRFFAVIGEAFGNIFSPNYNRPTFKARHWTDDAKNLRKDWEKVLGDFNSKGIDDQEDHTT